MSYKNYWRDPAHVDNLEFFWNEEDPLRRDPAYKCIRELHDQAGMVLDVGCGTLQDYAFFIQEGWGYIGLDPSPEMIAKAKQLHPQATIYEGDIVETRMKGRAFDLVYCCSVICHLPLEFVDLAIQNMARITRRHLIIYTPYVHDGPEPTVTETDPLDYIRNRFEFLDLQHRVSKFAKIKSIHRHEDAVAIRAEVD
jgi:SAM-dependent methyltransferase